ncbi:methyltransferase domain-containing protein [Puniceibacterium sp. IMCC21224]|uniref:methyltransferase domain-containing protein n=1 Tax=Puniceibacterium sp. IMCC21224 TaxID=1618204 RepID=UPI00065D1C43|nr:methyltransferase domain-containing protein [Puniceibacterium sp. IMCC21224]KMK68126.1 trans-aconitate methyltransferase [Puniceibacterium sp. IMCC21224]
MSQASDQDWNPGTYDRFRGLRLRPALDLLRAVGPLPEGDIIDLGCGTGSVGPALGQLRRRLIGVDASPAMMEHAARTGVYDELLQEDLTVWQATRPAALIFSNASLHWVPDHQTLFPRLVQMLAPGGVLAIQLPHQNNAPSHRLWVKLVDELFPGRVDHSHGPNVLLAAEYHRMLSAMGQVTLWDTEYYQELAPDGEGHPVRRFVEATFARPILNALEPDERLRLIAAYEAVIGKAYPKGPRGTVLFPFRRMFFTLSV